MIEKLYETMDEVAKEDTLFLCICGSHSYGTAIETSDIDVRGIFYRPLKDFLGARIPSVKHLVKTGKEIDYELHEIAKFGGLLMKGNPNTLDWLYSPYYKLYKMKKDEFLELRAIGKEFITKLIYKPYFGMHRHNLSHNRNFTDPKKTLIMIRSLLECKHALLNREIEQDLKKLMNKYDLQDWFIDLMEAKIHKKSMSSRGFELMRLIEKLEKDMGTALENSHLPEVPTDESKDKLDDFIIKLRRRLDF